MMQMMMLMTFDDHDVGGHDEDAHGVGDHGGCR